MQASGLTWASRTGLPILPEGETLGEAVMAALLGVVIAALGAASYLGWMLLTDPAALMQNVAAWVR